MSVKISELPEGLTTRGASIPANQGDSTVQLPLQPAAFNPVATRARVRSLAGDTAQVTPGGLSVVVEPLQNQIDNFWSAWTTP